MFKNFTALTIGILSVLSISSVMNLQKANAQPVADNDYEQKACRTVPGTYLTTISTSNGEFASRSLITLTADGNILVADSNQGGVAGVFNPFSNSQGAWKCRNGEITAKVLNFTLSGSEGSTGGIARENFSVRFNRRTQTLQGTINLRLFDLNANPQEDNGSDGGTFTFTGQRVTAE
jgi:hypothetical protein